MLRNTWYGMSINYARLLNEEFPWDKENLVLEDPVFGPQPQTNKGSVKYALTRMEKGKVSRTSGVVMEMLLAWK